MPAKNVPISVRLDEGDAQFLEQLEIDGAQTVSDKLRAIIDQARQREDGRHNYPAGLRMMDNLLDPVRMALANQERHEQVHSELMTRVHEWLPEMFAYVLASLDPEPDCSDRISLEELEAGVAERVFRLINGTLRLALSSSNPCYDPQAISRRLEDTLELAQLLAGRRRPDHEQGDR